MEAMPNFIAPVLPGQAGILQVLPAMETGGVERGTVEIAQAIVLAGGRALVASRGGRLVGDLARTGARHANMGLDTKNPFRILGNVGRLRRLIAEEQMDLVHARSRGPAWSAMLAARQLKLPFITTWHGVYEEDLPFKGLYNSVMARGDVVIAISHFIEAELHRRYRLDPARVRVIHRGADPARFDPASIAPERIERLAQKFRLPPGARAVMLPARLTRWKGAAVLLRAVAALPGDKPYVLLVGAKQRKPAYQRELEDLADQLNLGLRLRITGHCDDMAAAMMLADVVVNASEKPEPFGRSIVEAQALGRMVVGSDHGGAVETIAQEQTGWRVKPNDPAALSEMLAHVLTLSDSARARIAQAAMHSVRTQFSTAAMQRKTLSVYAEVLGRPVGPRQDEPLPQEEPAEMA